MANITNPTLLLPERPLLYLPKVLLPDPEGLHLLPVHYVVYGALRTFLLLSNTAGGGSGRGTRALVWG